MSQVDDLTRFEQALLAFDRANAEDPELIHVDGRDRPRELVDSERRSAWIERLEPNASEALRLAARCQHIRRWRIPRQNYDQGRVGYLKWRTQLARFHADTAAELLAAVGYDQPLIDEVRRINLKQNLHSHPDSQTMEDALCLAFLEFEFEPFRVKHEPAKVVEVVRKSWKKMSPRAREIALTLPLSEPSLELVRRALQPAP